MSKRLSSLEIRLLHALQLLSREPFINAQRGWRTYLKRKKEKSGKKKQVESV